MSTIVKDAEVLPASPEVAAPRAAAGNVVAPEFAAKPQPVALEVSITVNGARSVDGTDKREPFSESSKTVLVFANGAVIRLQSSVAPGQLLFLTNEKTKKEVVCQVVKSKNYRNVSGYVELEFTEPVIGFWGMRFPGDRIPQSSANVPAPAAITPAGSSPAIGIPTAPVASVPAATIASPAIPASSIPAAVSEPPKPVLPAVAETPKLVPTKLDAPPSAPHITAPQVSATPAVTVDSPVKPSSSASTPAPLDMNLLRRASDTKLRAIPAIPAVPSSPAPKPEALKPDASKLDQSVTADPTEALRAENARLHEQLSAFLGQSAKKSEQPAATASVPKVSPLSSLAGQISEIAAIPVSPAPPASIPDPEAKTVQSQTPEAAAFVAHPSTVKHTPVLAKMSSASLESLLDEEPVKIPAWLESLARHSANPSETKVESESPTSSLLTSPVESQDSSTASELESAAQDFHVDEEPASVDDASVTGTFEVPAPNFGSNSMFSDDQTSAEGAGKSKNGLVFGAIAAGVLLAAGVGYWYTHQNAAIFGGAQRSSQTASTSAPQPNSVASPSANISTADTQAPPSSTPANVSSTHAAGAAKDSAVASLPSNTNTAVTAARSVPPPAPPAATVTSPADAKTAAAQPKKPALGTVHLAAPKVSRRSDGSEVGEADVALNNSADAGDAALGAGFASSSGPAAPSAPVPIGGDVKSAKLLKTVPPVYPAFAKTQRVSGDVKVDALVDAEGRVTTMKVVSGPAMLHLAAMDALRQWKYQPATLDGKAVPMHLTVTIQFRLQ